MSEPLKRSTIYFDAALHTALRLKAAHSHRSVSEIVNDAVLTVVVVKARHRREVYRWSRSRAAITAAGQPLHKRMPVL